MPDTTSHAYDDLPGDPFWDLPDAGDVDPRRINDRAPPRVVTGPGADGGDRVPVHGDDPGPSGEDNGADLLLPDDEEALAEPRVVTGPGADGGNWVPVHGDDPGPSGEDNGADPLLPDDEEALAEPRRGDADGAAALPAIDVDPVDVVPDTGDIDVLDDMDDDRPLSHIIRHNRYFRCLGYLESENFFLSWRHNKIKSYTTSSMRALTLIELAPRAFWLELFPGAPNREGVVREPDWLAVADALVSETVNQGVWDPAREAGMGTRIDNGRVVFNGGSALWVKGIGTIPLNHEAASNGRYVYTTSRESKTPDFDAAFTPGCPEVQALRDIIERINWTPQYRSLSILAIFGFLCVGPICGILPWRPHVWLDGEAGAGKSWIVNNIIQKALSGFHAAVQANSTESGIRNNLNQYSFPLIFDEAEGGRDRDNQRMRGILELARHSATPGRSVVMQGVSGGGGQRAYSIASTFLMTSITAQLEEAADVSRFARAHLSMGLGQEEFERDLAGPARELLEDDGFARKFVAMIVSRADDLQATIRVMTAALNVTRVDRRIADVYGVFAAGTWLALRDGVPEDAKAAYAFIRDTFGVDTIGTIGERNVEVREEKDHHRVLNHMMSVEVRCETGTGQHNIRLGVIAIIAANIDMGEEETYGLQAEQARATLAHYGIKVGQGDQPLGRNDSSTATTLLLNRKTTAFDRTFERTPYQANHTDVLKQAAEITIGKTAMRVSHLSPAKPLVIPFDLLGYSGDA